MKISPDSYETGNVCASSVRIFFLDNSSIVISDDDETLNSSNNVSVVEQKQVDKYLHIKSISLFIINNI